MEIPQALPHWSQRALPKPQIGLLHDLLKTSNSFPLLLGRQSFTSLTGLQDLAVSCLTASNSPKSYLHCATHMHICTHAHTNVHINVHEHSWTQAHACMHTKIHAHECSIHTHKQMYIQRTHPDSLGLEIPQNTWPPFLRFALYQISHQLSLKIPTHMHTHTYPGTHNTKHVHTHTCSHTCTHTYTNTLKHICSLSPLTPIDLSGPEQMLLLPGSLLEKP